MIIKQTSILKNTFFKIFIIFYNNTFFDNYYWKYFEASKVNKSGKIKEMI